MPIEIHFVTDATTIEAPTAPIAPQIALPPNGWVYAKPSAPYTYFDGTQTLNVPDAQTAYNVQAGKLSVPAGIPPNTVRTTPTNGAQNDPEGLFWSLEFDLSGGSVYSLFLDIPESLREDQHGVIEIGEINPSAVILGTLVVTVADQAARLALPNSVGQRVYQTDVDLLFEQTGPDASDVNDWTDITIRWEDIILSESDIIGGVAGADGSLNDHLNAPDPHSQYILRADATAVAQSGTVSDGLGFILRANPITGKIDGNWLTTTTVPYAPTTPTDWEDPDPTTVQEALDKIAAERARLSGDTFTGPTRFEGGLTAYRAGLNSVFEVEADTGFNAVIDFIENSIINAKVKYDATNDWFEFVNELSGMTMRLLDASSRAQIRQFTNSDDTDVRLQIFGSGANGRPVIELKVDDNGSVTDRMFLIWDKVAGSAEIRNPQSGFEMRMLDAGTDSQDSVKFAFGDATVRTPVWAEEFTGTQATVDESITGNWDFDGVTDFDNTVNLNQQTNVAGDADFTGAMTRFGIREVEAFQFHRDTIADNPNALLFPTPLIIADGTGANPPQTPIVIESATFTEANGEFLVEAWALVSARQQGTANTDFIETNIRLELWDPGAGQALGDFTTNSGLVQPGFRCEFRWSIAAGSIQSGPNLARGIISLSARFTNPSPPRTVQLRVIENIGVGAYPVNQITELFDARWRVHRIA